MTNLFKPLAVLAFIGALFSTTAAAGSDIPSKKKTREGLYLTAVQAAKMLQNESILFVDVRSRAEVSFVGLPTRVNANIPLMLMPKDAVYDPDKQTYKLQFNPDFVFAFESLLSDLDYDENAPIVLICRSGSRSAKAANLLNELGYMKIYSVIDGFEGDKMAEGPHAGHRELNGWKNAGLEWSYHLTPAQHYIMDGD
ncbi:MAG: rhodanese-like domain-containing protein [Thalassovita sp.]|nr:rhodanese-like domain-containing protein [Thalassovita sp.]